MTFYNFNGPKTKDNVLAIIDDCIKAYESLKNVGIENPIFENGNASCVDVVEEFENLKRIVNAFADKGEYNNDRIVEFQGWDFERLFGSKIDTYEDLNKAIFKRIEFLKTSFRKVEIKPEIHEKPLNKSVDRNVRWTMWGTIATFVAAGISAGVSLYGIHVQHKDAVLDRHNQVIQQTVPQSQSEPITPENSTVVVPTETL